jgi:hypothetical protein
MSTGCHHKDNDLQEEYPTDFFKFHKKKLSSLAKQSQKKGPKKSRRQAVKEENSATVCTIFIYWCTRVSQLFVRSDSQKIYASE